MRQLLLIGLLGCLLGTEGFRLCAQPLLVPDTTYAGVLQAAFNSPDLRIIFEQDQSKIVMTYFNWYASYSFINGRLYQAEISNTYQDFKMAEVEYDKYKTYVASQWEVRPVRERRSRKMLFYTAANNRETINIRVAYSPDRKVAFAACITYCHIAPTSELEPGDCYTP